MEILAFIFLLTAFAEESNCGPGLDVALIGDSQFNYFHQHGASEFLSDFSKNCRERPGFQAVAKSCLNHIGYGVNASGAQHWTTVVTDENKNDHWVCRKKAKYNQFGNDNVISKKELCQIGSSPMQKILARKPRMIVGSFLGHYMAYANEAEIRVSIADFIGKLPPDTPCLIMGSPPMLEPSQMAKEVSVPYMISLGSPSKREGHLRLINRIIRKRRLTTKLLKKVVEESRKCQFMSGTNPKTESLMSSEYTYFNGKRKSGKANAFIDQPYYRPDFSHVSAKGSRKFFEIKKVEFCDFLIKSLSDPKIENQEHGPPSGIKI